MTDSWPNHEPPTGKKMDDFIFGVGRKQSSELEIEELTLPEVEDKRSIEPITDWSSYWDSSINVETDRGSFCVYMAGEGPLTMICLHGAGHTALTWSMVASLMKSRCRVIAMDIRGHGYSEVENEHEMSVSNLVEDLRALLKELLSEPVPIVLMGHSMGGAFAIHAAHEIENVVGLVVLDVVEGTALNSLVHMRRILNKRPKMFPDHASAIQWAYQTGEVKNLVSCRISIPPQLKEDHGKVVWRTDLLATEPYWKEWFTGISDKFLGTPASKLLMLAGTDRLDKPLTIGHMQGKYQLEIMPVGVGHCIQEEVPIDLAKKLIAYMKRNKFMQMWKLNQKLRKK